MTKREELEVAMKRIRSVLKDKEACILSACGTVEIFDDDSYRIYDSIAEFVDASFPYDHPYPI